MWNVLVGLNLLTGAGTLQSPVRVVDTDGFRIKSRNARRQLERDDADLLMLIETIVRGA